MKSILWLILIGAAVFVVARLAGSGDPENAVAAAGQPIRVSEVMERHREMTTPGAKPMGPVVHPVTGEVIQRVLRPGDIE